MQFVDICFMGLKGGSGGIYGTDGYDHIGMIDASGGVLDQDYEIFEQATPHLVLKHEYLDRLGRPRPLAWRHRGGDHVRVPRQEHPGGHLRRRRRGALPRTPRVGWKARSTSSSCGTRASGDWRTLTTKDLVHGVPDGTIYFQQASGGGGWGDPKQRPAEKVLRDVRNEMVSMESARRDYGVAIDADAWTVDEEATKKLRAK